jgi:hypothetical protein
MSPQFELGAWTPDQPEVSNQALAVARNVLPRASGYDSLPTLSSANAGSLNALCRGAFTGRARNGTNFTVAGSATQLSLATTGSLSNVSNGGGSPYTLTSDNWWSFALFGNRIIASSHSDAPESFVVGTSTQFAALSADAPRARHMAVVRDFLVHGNIIGRGANAGTIGTAEEAVQWSAVDDPTSYPAVGTSSAKGVQSDWQPLTGNGGQVTALIGGSDYGLVFQERSVWRMDYEGGDTFFRFTPIEENRGCWIPKAAIRVGGLTFFPAEDGFFATDGFQTVSIGNELVDRFFLESFQDDTEARLSVAYFPSWKCIGWLYMGPNASSELCNKMLLFNVVSQRWSEATVSAEWLVAVLPFATSLDSYTAAGVMDTGALSAVNLDSLLGTARREPGAFNASHALATFSGSPGTAVIETHEFEPAPGRVGYLRSLRPVYDSGESGFVAQALTRQRLSDTQTASSGAYEDTTGKHNLRVSGRYLAARFYGYGEFTNFSGFDADVAVRGAR